MIVVPFRQKGPMVRKLFALLGLLIPALVLGGQPAEASAHWDTVSPNAVYNTTSITWVLPAGGHVTLTASIEVFSGPNVRALGSVNCKNQLGQNIFCDTIFATYVVLFKNGQPAAQSTSQSCNSCGPTLNVSSPFLQGHNHWNAYMYAVSVKCLGETVSEPSVTTPQKNT